MTVYAVIDTNVIVSAMLSGHSDTATVQVMARVISGEITPLFSAEIMDEYREVLGRKKFSFSQENVKYILAAIEKYGVLVEPAAVEMVLPDRKDLPFYEVVLEKREEGAYLVTGNIRHFPQEAFIVTARQMLDILEKIITTG